MSQRTCKVNLTCAIGSATHRKHRICVFQFLSIYELQHMGASGLRSHVGHLDAPISLMKQITFHASRLESWEMSSFESANSLTLAMTACADCNAWVERMEPFCFTIAEILSAVCCKVAIVLAFCFSTLLSRCCFFLASSNYIFISSRVIASFFSGVGDSSRFLLVVRSRGKISTLRVVLVASKPREPEDMMETRYTVPKMGQTRLFSGLQPSRMERAEKPRVFQTLSGKNSPWFA